MRHRPDQEIKNETACIKPVKRDKEKSNAGKGKSCPVGANDNKTKWRQEAYTSPDGKVKKECAGSSSVQSCREMRRWAGELPTTLYRHAVKMDKEIGDRVRG
jgi:Tfp pilus assembly protein PilV